MKGGRHVSKYFSTFLRWLGFGKVHFSDWTPVFRENATVLFISTKQENQNTSHLRWLRRYIFLFRINPVWNWSVCFIKCHMRSFEVKKVHWDFYAFSNRILSWAQIYFIKIFKIFWVSLTSFELCILKHSFVGSIYWRQSPFRVCFLFPHSDLICKFTFCISKNSVSFMKFHQNSWLLVFLAESAKINIFNFGSKVILGRLWWFEVSSFFESFPLNGVNKSVWAGTTLVMMIWSFLGRS